MAKFTALRVALLFCLMLPLSAFGQPLAGVIVREAVIKPFPLAAEALGNARANEDVEIRPEITAAVVEILFQEGQAVEQGTILLRLESSEPLAQLAARVLEAKNGFDALYDRVAGRGFVGGSEKIL